VSDWRVSESASVASFAGSCFHLFLSRPESQSTPKHILPSSVDCATHNQTTGKDFGKFFLTHAGINKFDFNYLFKDVSAQDEDAYFLDFCNKKEQNILWRNTDFNSLYEFKTGTQVVGHKVVKNGPLITDKYIACDTGSGFLDGRLSAVIMPDKIVVS
jgi:predicted hydrocarbon binding protein